MAQLAIQGHPKQGNEIINIFETLGAKNKQRVDAIRRNYIYFIDRDIINFLKINQVIDGQFNIFTLKEFKEKFPYKVGDKIKNTRINNLIGKIINVRWDDNEEQIIYAVKWNNECILTYFARDLQAYKEEDMKNKLNLLQQLKDYFDNTPKEVVEKEWHEYDKYNEIGPKVNEYLEYINSIRQPKYPKTYEECCDVLKIPNDERYIHIDVPLDYNKLLSVFTKLLICYKAYCKIAGEEMSLDKPWEANWLYNRQDKYVIFTQDNIICVDCYVLGHNILAFPTEEMRDTFHGNFKDLIETCKELL